MRKLKVNYKKDIGKESARGEKPIKAERGSEVAGRQKQILGTVVDEYIKHAFPISSDFLKRERGLNISPATIRLDFAELTDRGYLEKAYISSGRVPTDKGYRFFVDSFFKKKKRKKKNQFKEIFQQGDDTWQLSYQAAEALAQLSSDLSIAHFKNDIFWKEGWQKVAQAPEFRDIDYFKSFLEMVHQFESDIDKLTQPEGLQVFIGKECPLREKGFSMVIGRRGEDAFALLGPKRMDFTRNIFLIESLLEAVESL